MLLCRGAAPISQCISEIFVEDDGMGLHQFARTATRYQGLMNFAVVAFAKLGVIAYQLG
jgi:hypothetical protein